MPPGVRKRHIHLGLLQLLTFQCPEYCGPGRDILGRYSGPHKLVSESDLCTAKLPVEGAV